MDKAIESLLFSDTPAVVERKLVNLLQQAPPWRKLEMVGQMNVTVHGLAISGLRSRHPQDSPEELRQRLADLLLGPELARRVYAPHPQSGETEHD
ncbi:MAG: hypothetical protein COS85_01970 [Armatimonadetes bacterium CG07_land_8_20_14_0_80_59_28]|nr:MAG: hypothetical protein COS85_01970 [Armatimonadetes bacterium CG07_land_8_20_14_0_80_59_28]PIY48413.1 MAG: hypothetical protein COZ05_03240 [Armatimonadetes bacterium CG_4_10_14_3_um_filter_59_10]PJB77880.1 MAG: hypothetical protein CO095_01135 [Armatimonadetes bacterium CG_4_9_14_3_um_filter_58_7]